MKPLFGGSPSFHSGHPTQDGTSIPARTRPLGTSGSISQATVAYSNRERSRSTDKLVQTRSSPIAGEAGSRLFKPRGEAGSSVRRLRRRSRPRAAPAAPITRTRRAGLIVRKNAALSVLGHLDIRPFPICVLPCASARTTVAAARSHVGPQPRRPG